MLWLGFLEREIFLESVDPVLVVISIELGRMGKGGTLKAGNSRSSSFVRPSIRITVVLEFGRENVDIFAIVNEVNSCLEKMFGRRSIYIRWPSLV